MTVTQQPKVWFVTGSSTGLGRCLVEYLLTKGENVVATLRKPEVLNDLKATYPSTQLLILRLDISKLEEIEAAFDKVKQVFGRLDVVVNNAGYGIIGEMEDTPEDVARTMYDCNFWGTTNISRRAVKFFRDVNKPAAGGRLLNISSMAGVRPFPMTGYYSSSKFAIECFTQALSQEIDPDWNIKITLIELGGFKTNGRESAVELPLNPAYNKPTLPSVIFRDYLAKGDNNGGDPMKAVAKWYEVAQLPDPPMRLVLGQDAIAMVRAQIETLTKDVDASESWSKDLAFDKQ
ncbi:hypothetical protein EIP91_004650 [Steccherinum ochraceum]|uniref:NAD(P)-binding protein n=1 Tax=Steccherinum ochraceum TaxID=92696 RepID=A0A4R0RN17_9APHY|nr:hypothetical protein EIP91_004650 [Steccherinum ochraceum]